MKKICPKCNRETCKNIIYCCCCGMVMEELDERKVCLNELKAGQKFTLNDMLLEKTSDTERDGWDILCYNHTFKHICRVGKNVDVNLRWWEALENPTKIEIMQAYEDGAEIEFKVRTIRSQDWSVLLSSKSPLWNWADCNYRIKPTTHKIKIDGKEIEISEESYNKLKESLIKD